MVEIEQKRYADDMTLQELVRLRVENDKLKTAMQLILDHPVEETEEWQTAVEEIKAIAFGVMREVK